MSVCVRFQDKSKNHFFNRHRKQINYIMFASLHHFASATFTKAIKDIQATYNFKRAEDIPNQLAIKKTFRRKRVELFLLYQRSKERISNSLPDDLKQISQRLRERNQELVRLGVRYGAKWNTLEKQVSNYIAHLKIDFWEKTGEKEKQIVWCIGKFA